MLFNPCDLEFDKWNFKLCEFDALFGCKRLDNTDLWGSKELKANRCYKLMRSIVYVVCVLAFSFLD